MEHYIKVHQRREVNLTYYIKRTIFFLGDNTSCQWGLCLGWMVPMDDNSGSYGIDFEHLHEMTQAASNTPIMASSSSPGPLETPHQVSRFNQPKQQHIQ